MSRLAVLPQYVLPTQALTALAGRIASAEAGPVTTAMIRWFVKRYGVDMREAQNPDPASYRSFNEFFTRPLKPGARPIAAADLICPIDGAVSQHQPRLGIGHDLLPPAFRPVGIQGKIGAARAQDRQQRHHQLARARQQ